MTDAELTIMSLVAEGARYGHEIQQLIDERGLREWLSIGFSSVYYILNKLERQKLLASRLHKEGYRVPQKVYELTEGGRGVLQTAITDLLRQPRSLGTGFELGLANLTVLKPQQVYNVLTQHYHELRQRLDAIENSWQAHVENDDAFTAEHISALYTHSIALMEAEEAWLQAFLDDWRQRYPAVESYVRAGEGVIDTSSTPTQPHFHQASDPAQ